MTEKPPEAEDEHMIKLVKEKVNRVTVGVTAIIDYSGFSATLDLMGTTKTLSDLSDKNLWIEFSPSDVAKVEETTYGTLTVLNKEGKVHSRCLVTFSAVDTEREALGWQRLIITLVALLKYEGSRRGGGGDPSDPATKADVQKVQDSVDALSLTVDNVSTQVTEVSDSVDKILYNNWDESDEELHLG
jgi:hypothetical protein